MKKSNFWDRKQARYILLRTGWNFAPGSFVSLSGDFTCNFTQS